MVYGTWSQPQLLVLHGAGQEVATQKRSGTELYPSRPTTFQRGLNFRFPQPPLTAQPAGNQVFKHTVEDGVEFTPKSQRAQPTYKIQAVPTDSGLTAHRGFCGNTQCELGQAGIPDMLAKGNEPVNTCLPPT